MEMHPVKPSPQSQDPDTNWSLKGISWEKVTAFAIGVFAVGGFAYFMSRPTPTEDSSCKESHSSSSTSSGIGSKSALTLSGVVNLDTAAQYLVENKGLSLQGAQANQVTCLSQVVELTRLNLWLVEIAKSPERWAWAFTGFEQRAETDLPQIIDGLSSYVENGFGGLWLTLCLEHSLCCRAVWIYHESNKIEELVEKAWDVKNLPETTARFGMLYCNINPKQQAKLLYKMEEDQDQAVLVLGVAYQILREKKGARALIDPMIKDPGGTIDRKALAKCITKTGDLICLHQAGKAYRSYHFLERKLQECFKGTFDTYQIPKNLGKVPFEYEYLSLDLLSPDHVLDVVVTLNTASKDESKTRCHPKCVDLLFYYAHHKKGDHYLAALQGLCKLPFAKILGNEAIRKNIKELVRDEPFKDKKRAIGNCLAESFQKPNGLSEDMLESLRVLFKDELEQPVPKAIRRKSAVERKEVHFEQL